LAAIQARIDPQFFFDMLDAVQRTYEVDIDRAESLLDELIVFLRAALPRLRTTTSTVAQECELTKSYARLRKLQGRSDAEIDLVIPEGLRTAPFPPGVLLPIVDSVLRAASTERSLLLRADVTSSRIVLSLASSARPVPDAVARVEATLADLFGDGAGVTLSGLPDQAVLTTVRVPYEPTGE
jgi:LytS/YehU family sensor histidine kinase